MNNLDNMSWADIQREYPKAAKAMDYITKHYPDDAEAISKHKMVGPMIMNPAYSNTQIEEMIDKIAIFTGWKKYEVKS